MNKSLWKKANQKLLTKSLSELSWEEAIIPEKIASGHNSHDDYQLTLENRIEYRFKAWASIWGQLVIDSASITRSNESAKGHEPVWDVSQFYIDAQSRLGMTPATLSQYLEELANTLMADVQILANYQNMTARQMIELPDDKLQCFLDGHPKVTVSKGRIGWGLDDYQAYGPEFMPNIQLEWLALNRVSCQLSLTENLQEQELLNAVLDEQEQQRLHSVCDQQRLDLNDYFLLPVHPWQWRHRLVNLFAGELAAGRILHLGAFGDPMLPQQSLRTLSNRARPEQLNIKLPLSILNTSCYRGIPGQYITAGPLLSRWLWEIAESDRVLASRGTVILKEPAGAFYPQPHQAQITAAPYRYHEMLGCIWRDSVHARCAPDEKVILMSTLFQEDGFGQALISEYIRQSELTTELWLMQLFDAVVIPLYHLLCKYGVGLVAHGQNVSVILRNNRPVKVALKDFQGDLRLIDDDFPELASLPESVRSVTTRLPDQHLIHDLQTGHFVSVMRFISMALVKDGFSESRFYRLLGVTLKRYMDAHPELEPRFKRFNLFTPTMARICLNRVRFKRGYGDRTDRPLPELGSDLQNPLALNRA